MLIFHYNLLYIDGIWLHDFRIIVITSDIVTVFIMRFRNMTNMLRVLDLDIHLTRDILITLQIRKICRMKAGNYDLYMYSIIGRTNYGIAIKS